jgi:hypothetical protein
MAERDIVQQAAWLANGHENGNISNSTPTMEVWNLNVCIFNYYITP